eukprot:820806-Pelagomonas_calceolata.AAC.2
MGKQITGHVAPQCMTHLITCLLCVCRLEQVRLEVNYLDGLGKVLVLGPVKVEWSCIPRSTSTGLRQRTLPCPGKVLHLGVLLALCTVALFHQGHLLSYSMDTLNLALNTLNQRSPGKPLLPIVMKRGSSGLLQMQ